MLGNLRNLFAGSGQLAEQGVILGPPWNILSQWKLHLLFAFSLISTRRQSGGVKPRGATAHVRWFASALRR